MMPKLGGGGRFAAGVAKLSNEPGVRNPAALEASFGIKKYGAKKMGAMAAAGRKRGIMGQHLGGM
jgi:hypothetical protein